MGVSNELTVTFLAAGLCRQKARMAGRLEKGTIDFHAVFLHVTHPTQGSYLIDTGYGPAYREATRKFPERMLELLLPSQIHEGDEPDSQLRSQGLDPGDLKGILLSHFHGDHIGGLRQFGAIPIWARRASFDAASRGGRLRQVKRGFLRALLPGDFSNRVQWVGESLFTDSDPELLGFRVWDQWGDGSLKWVDLPGHAAGHVGFLLRSSQGPLFYIVDACWDLESMLEGRRLPLLGRMVQHDSKAYEQTQAQLLAWHRVTEIPLVACHCQRTLQRVQAF